MDVSNQQVQRLPEIGKLIAETWRIYKEKFWTLFSLTAIPLALSLLASILQGNTPLQGNMPAGQEIRSINLLFFPIMLVLIIVGLWTFVSLFYVINNREKSVGFKEAMANGWPRIVPFFWISFLTGLISMLGFFLFIIPGIIFSVWYILSEYVFIAEGLKGAAALKRSKELVKGFWWKVFWRFLGFGFIIFLAMIPVLIITLVLSFFGLTLVGAILNSIFNALITPLSAVYGFLVYESLKKAKSGNAAAVISQSL
jgi:hypothetical protein